jgi:hypothetical protein
MSHEEALSLPSGTPVLIDNGFGSWVRAVFVRVHPVIKRKIIVRIQTSQGGFRETVKICSYVKLAEQTQ